MFSCFGKRLWALLTGEEKTQRRGKLFPTQCARPRLETLEDRAAPSSFTMPSPNSPAPLPPATSAAAIRVEPILNAFDDRVEATFHAFNGRLMSLESSLTARDPSLASHFSSLNTTVVAQENAYVDRLDAVGAVAIHDLNRV